MRFQSREYTCGPVCLQNALRAIGVRVGEKRLAAMCGCCAEGTDEANLVGAIEALGLTPAVISTSNVGEARRQLRDALLGGAPVLLCVDEWNHWITVIGVLGAAGDWRAVVIDSSRVTYNRAENGVHVVRASRLLRRWRAGRRTAGGEPVFYGIAVARPLVATGRQPAQSTQLQQTCPAASASAAASWAPFSAWK